MKMIARLIFYPLFIVFVIFVIRYFILWPSPYNKSQQKHDNKKTLQGEITIKKIDKTQKSTELTANIEKFILDLWKIGITEEDVISALSERRKIAISNPCDISALALPEEFSINVRKDRYELYDKIGKSTQYITKGQTIQLHYIEPLSAFNLETIKTAAKKYFSYKASNSNKDGFSRHHRIKRFMITTPTGNQNIFPFAGGGKGTSMLGDIVGVYLLASAVKFKDKALASSLYRVIMDDHDSEETFREKTIIMIAWDNFRNGIEAYQRKDDDTAVKYLNAVLLCEPYMTSNSYFISQYITTVKRIFESMELQKQESTIEMPDRGNKKAYRRYWIKKIKEINGKQYSQPGYPTIWGAHMVPYGKRKPDFASDRLRELGIKVLPHLVNMFPDTTCTRTVGFHRDFKPSRYILTVGRAAQMIFKMVCADYGLDPPLMNLRTNYTDKKEFIRFKTVFYLWYLKNKDAKKLPASERKRNLWGGYRY